MKLFSLNWPSRQNRSVKNQTKSPINTLGLLLGALSLHIPWAQANTHSADEPTPLDPVIEIIMQHNNIPGVAVALIANPEDPIIWSKGYGVTNIDHPLPMTENSAFWMGSISKAVTGTAIMHAQQQGYLHLDQPIAPLLKERGEFKIGKRQLRSLNLRHLASHTGSIFDNQDRYQCAYRYNTPDGNTDYLANWLGDSHNCPNNGPDQLDTYLQAYLDRNGQYFRRGKNFINKKPGQIHNYSNIGAALAGYTVGLATSQELPDYAQRHIFTPLAMHNTSWRLNDFQNDQLVSGHTVSNGSITALPHYNLATWPDGGLRSSASDMARLLATVMNEGRFGREGYQLLKPEYNQAMLALTQQAADPSPQYGVFWHHSVMEDIEGKTHRVIGHDGGDPGIATFAYFSPAHKAGFVVLMNQDELEFQHITFLNSVLLSAAITLGETAKETM